MSQHRRTPTTLVLLLTAAALVYLYVAGGSQVAADQPGLAELELAIAQPDAAPATWRLFAQRLHEAGRLDHAAVAYRRCLESDPYDREVRLHCASVLALTGDAESFLEFMRDMVLIDAKLAVEVFNRPESKPYLARADFQALQAEAVSQSMD